MVSASEADAQVNPGARSAKLRAYSVHHRSG